MNHLMEYYPPLLLLVFAILGIGIVIDTALEHNKWFAVVLVPFVVLGAAATMMLFS